MRRIGGESLLRWRRREVEGRSRYKNNVSPGVEEYVSAPSA
mgnify:FL=1